MISLYHSKHNFDVIRSAGNSTYNFVNPVRRDVVSAGLAGDNTTIRFQTDNAGPWILHWFVVLFSTFLLFRASNDISRSHIDWHLDLYVPFLFFEQGCIFTPFAGDLLSFLRRMLPRLLRKPHQVRIFFSSCSNFSSINTK